MSWVQARRLGIAHDPACSAALDTIATLTDELEALSNAVRSGARQSPWWAVRRGGLGRAAARQQARNASPLLPSRTESTAQLMRMQPMTKARLRVTGSTGAARDETDPHVLSLQACDWRPRGTTAARTRTFRRLCDWRPIEPHTMRTEPQRRCSCATLQEPQRTRSTQCACAPRTYTPACAPPRRIWPFSNRRMRCGIMRASWWSSPTTGKHSLGGRLHCSYWTRRGRHVTGRHSLPRMASALRCRGSRCLMTRRLSSCCPQSK
jgi:hypothetical protein